ncbi:MAG: FtsQ-type POTRA domain-containing protein [Patescibacteria group bacterium]|nr:FtsQ-type POTRA domain-containing protein [Patescibacteria group bacterium]
MKQNTINKIIYALTTAISLLLIVYGCSQVFKIKNIETTAREEDMQGFPYLGNRYLFSIYEAELNKFFLRNPEIKKISVQKRFPNTLYIDVVYRTKLAQIFSDDNLFILDEEGLIFEREASLSALPLIQEKPKSLNLGTNITQSNILVALKILNTANRYNLRFVDIVPLDESTVEMSLDNGTRIVIGLNAKAEDIVSSLQMILKRFTIEGKTISKIDYRFEKPVITF